MTYFYLVFVVLLNTGQPANTVAHSFNTLMECETAGLAVSADLVNDTKVDRAAWQCLSVDFSKVDPVEKPPLAPKSNT